jgi:hypothetical protein
MEAVSQQAKSISGFAEEESGAAGTETTGSAVLQKFRPSAIPPYTKGQAQNPSKNGSVSENRSLSKRREPRFKGAARKAGALRQLGVSEEQLAAQPEISSMLKPCAGGIKAALAALRFSSHPVAKAFLEKYDACSPSVRHFAPLEAIAIAAGIDLAHLLGAFFLALRKHSAMAVALIAISNHPDIVKAQVLYALKPGGWRDREMLNLALGFLPSEQSPTGFFGKPGNNGDASAGPNADEAEANVNDIFPDPVETQKRLAPIRQKQLRPED